VNGQYAPGDKVLVNWKLTRLIGEGSFGRVFEASREEFGRVYQSAIKIITIPQSQSEIRSVLAEIAEESMLSEYFRTFVDDLVNEVSLMSRLKGNSNIVSYEDHSVIRHKDKIGWDIIVRMELLTPLLQYLIKQALTWHDVIRLGIDLCRALELCQKYNIIHRDIKPENIFIAECGDFKLGDFGIARTVEMSASGLTRKGTFTYMAPEVYRGDSYDSSVDIYSLGIVLYRMLNDNRAPFMPDYPKPVTHTDRSAALTKRIGGVDLPRPKNAIGRMAEIVLKACSFRPADRYSTPKQMRAELQAELYKQRDKSMTYSRGRPTHVKLVEYTGNTPPHPEHGANAGTGSMSNNAKYCANCGAPLNADTKSCSRCGRSRIAGLF